MMNTVISVYSRHGCHLCESAIDALENMKQELKYAIDVIYIDGNDLLEKTYGEQVPVIHIDGIHHDYWRLDTEKFRSCLEIHRQHQ